MRVIVATALNSGAAEYKNMGDVAMLQVAIKRLLCLWPNAHIDVLTDSASGLAQFCPEAFPLPRSGCACWMSDRVLLGRYHQILPKWVSERLRALKWAIGTRWPVLLEYLTLAKLRYRDPKGLLGDCSAFLNAEEDCDLMVVCGSGGFADSSRGWNLFILGAITGALGRGKKVAMLGQGIGPLTDPPVLSWARRVLPRVSLIGLRGTKGGRELLDDMGVSPSRVVITGDDALELDYEIDLNAPRRAIGVNLRSAPYSNVNGRHVAELRGVLHDAARRYNANLLPIPITSHDYANDCETIRQLLIGFDDKSDGGAELDTPLKVVEQTARCRVVVTGAYHSAVFALGMGIPAICLFNSSYYAAKFEGLKECFGPGCWIISLSEPDCAVKLATAVNDAWGSADNVRENLLGSAKDQIEAGRSAYWKLKDLDYAWNLNERVVSFN